MVKHKSLGQVYTPLWIVSEILDLVGYRGEHILDKPILEPSCGDGMFLIEIVNRYILACNTQNKTVKDIIAGLEKNIYGVELDAVEYQKCIANLNTCVKNTLGISTTINWRIYNQNTLDFYKQYPHFFDFIVGNPPYIRIHNLDADTRQILKQDFKFCIGTTDIYVAFFEMGFAMLAPKGLLGYITPNSYLHNSSYKSFRQYLATQKNVDTLIDFKANKIFKGFSTYTAITILRANFRSDSFAYKEWQNEEIQLLNHIKFADTNIKDWSFTDATNETFLANLQIGSTHCLHDFFDVQYGFATLRDKIYIGKAIDFNTELMLFNNCKIEKSILKTVIKASRYKGIIHAEDKIIFPYELKKNRYMPIPEEKLKTNYPYAYAYLLHHKTELQLRDIDKGATWYEFGRSQGIQTMAQEKIILSTLVNDQIFFYKVSKDVMVYSGLFIVKNKTFSDWQMLEHTLQSPSFFQYIRLTGKDFSGGYKSVTSKQIKEFRIRVANT
jgi:adenine-specific DNA-methyltransferase